MKAYRVGRVSTEGQGEVSIPDQDRFTAEYVARKGWEDGGFRFDKQTGTNTNRPEWLATVAACERGDAIVVHKVDRFARSLRHGVNEIARLAELGIDIVIVDPELDCTTPFGRAFRSMLLVFAELDRELIVSRMASGQYGAARMGRWPSSAAGAPFGMRKVGMGEESHLEEDPHEAEVIRTAARLLVDDRLSKQQTCEVLNARSLLPRKAPRWSPDLLAQVMSETARKGVVTWGKARRIASRNGGKPYGEPTLIAAPAILTPERFDLVQLALSRTSHASPLATSRVYPLSLRMTSPCGQVYYGRCRNDRANGAAYRCRGIKWRSDPGWEPCGCPPLESTELEGRVWAEVTALLGDPDRLRVLANEYLGLAGEQADAHGGELARLDREIATLRDRVSADLDGFIEAGLDPQAVAASMARLTDKLAALERRRADVDRLLSDAQARGDGLDQLAKLAATASARLADASLAMQDEVLALLDVRVTVLDRTKTPALQIEGVICSEEIAGQDAPGNPSGQPLRSVPAGITVPFDLTAA